MSFSRKKYDEQCYINQNKNDDSINNYLLNAPENDCNNCYPSNPEIRFQKKSGREDVVVENDLFGIDRKDTCNNEYNGCTNGTCKTQEFDNFNAQESVNDCSINTINSRFNSVKNLKNYLLIDGNGYLLILKIMPYPILIQCHPEIISKIIINHNMICLLMLLMKLISLIMLKIKIYSTC